MHHDLIVIGDGVAAHAAALEGERLGLDVLLVLPSSSGGGVDPLHASLRRALACRILSSEPGPGPRQTRSQVRTAARDALRRIEGSVLAHVDSLLLELRGSRVQRLKSPVLFQGPGEIQLGSETRSAAAILVSEAPRARRPGFFAFDDRVICDRDSIFRTGALPRSLAVVGADEYGCELACVFAALGVAVVLIDRRGRLMRAIDRDLLRILHGSMKEAGIDIVLDEEIESARVIESPREPYAQLELSSGRVERFECVAVCAGSTPDLESAAFGRTSIDRDSRGFLITDEYGRTSQPEVYGIGEVSGPPSSLGTQLHRARVAVLHAAGHEPELAEQAPHCVYTIPEIASVGLSDEACERLGIAHVVGMAGYPPGAGCDEGLLKLVAEAESGRLLGVHVVGAQAGDTLQLGLEYLRRGASLDAVAGAIFNTPGPSDAYRQAARDASACMGTRALRAEIPQASAEDPTSLRRIT